MVEHAKAEAESLRLLGQAEATSIEAIGRAEAERMRMKAAAYQQYGEAALTSMVLESLPKVSRIEDGSMEEGWERVNL